STDIKPKNFFLIKFCLLFFNFRLRCLVKQLERGEASVVDLKKNLEYAASVLESVYIEETRDCMCSVMLSPYCHECSSI
uniref:Uncharacterized protein n=1 Tax=Sinocyclocheilus rhinocerous TaxID=307959 RepID=A0A673IKL7_9TELE